MAVKQCGMDSSGISGP